jgi:hypothetical protein
MRAYFLTNMYLSSIQHGIQSLHALQEINNKYGTTNELLVDWAENHKTAIVLNGGTSEQMANIVNLLNNETNEYPWAIFNEPSIDNALTSIGIIVPDTIYGRERSDFGTFEYELSQLLRNRGFAR